MILVSEIANLIEGEIDGNPHLKIYGVCNIKNGEEGKISFLGNSKYNDFLSTTNSSAIIVKTNHKFKNTEKTLIRVENPTLGFAKVLEIFDKNKSFKNEINPTAIFDKTVILGKNISLGANVVIGKNCIIGKNSSIKANVTIYNDTVIGESVTIDSGTVIGADGFGWIPDKNGLYKIPQIGNVIIEDNVVIGGNSAVQQFTRIGKMAMIGGMTGVLHDVIPYGLSTGNRNSLQGLNLIGLRRAKFENKDILGLSEAYKEIFATKNINENINKLNGSFQENPLVKNVIDFIIKDKKRSICTPFS